MLELSLAPIDMEFGAFLETWALEQGASKQDARICRTLAASLSHMRGQGHSCLFLEEVAGQTVSLSGHEFTLPGVAACVAALQTVIGQTDAAAPLVLDDAHRLYLYRYAQAERRLADAICTQIQTPPTPIDTPAVCEAFPRLFPPLADDEIDWQAVAAFTSLRQGISVIAGGAGTGKTTTVTRMLVLFLLQQPDARVALAAPTGKAASRLKESIHAQWTNVTNIAQVDVAPPEEAKTIHRLLGQQYPSGRLRYNEENPLPYDLLVVDETSMVDLLMMDALVRACKPGAKLILLGDPHQLASIETGAVLGDLCQCAYGKQWSLYNAKTEGFGAAFHALTGCALPPNAAAGPLQDAVTTLVKAYRYEQEAPALQTLADAILRSDETAIFDVLASGTDCITWYRDTGEWNAAVKAQVASMVMHTRGFFEDAGTDQAAKAAAAVQTLGHWRILCAIHMGDFGVRALNRIAEACLHTHHAPQRYQPLTPIMIEGNHYGVNLMNGDMGICVPDASGVTKVNFCGEGGALRSFSPGSLPAHTEAHAISIHKSQGSEFDTVMIVLPDADSQILTRELFYTAVTRAKKKVVLFAAEASIRAAIRKPTRRGSGLYDLLQASK